MHKYRNISGFEPLRVFFPVSKEGGEGLEEFLVGREFLPSDPGILTDVKGSVKEWESGTDGMGKSQNSGKKDRALVLFLDFFQMFPI